MTILLIIIYWIGFIVISWFITQALQIGSKSGSIPITIRYLLLYGLIFIFWPIILIAMIISAICVKCKY